ncbi:MAG: SRPBCC family protein [Bacteroidetes bacterium]|nr:MAG: SRPBCC family protein [Bacteroidota bacterium]TAG87990.1 MAG: SRPBCC family protein [Bacteroidota bacterium]
MLKSFFKIALGIIFLFVVSIILLIIFSPYQNNKDTGYKCIALSIEISQPVEKVFAYLGNSKNASKWSVYVDHITTLNGDKIPDGGIGSTRRCFKEKNEKGIVWDEDIVEVIPNVKRRLSIYNAKGFPIIAEGILTEQLYKPLNDSTTHLTFTVFNKNSNPDFFTTIKTYFASYSISDIFKSNLKNIKKCLENEHSLNNPKTSRNIQTSKILF